MLDCKNKEIKINDYVVYPVNLSTDMYRLHFGVVEGFTKTSAIIKNMFGKKTIKIPEKLLVITRLYTDEELTSMTHI